MNQLDTAKMRVDVAMCSHSTKGRSHLILELDAATKQRTAMAGLANDNNAPQIKVAYESQVGTIYGKQSSWQSEG